MVGVYIYLGTVVGCHIINTVAVYSAKKEAENRGYKSVERTKNIARDILIYIKFLGLSIVPLLNLAITGVILLYSDEFTESLIKEMIEDGKLIKIEEENLESEVITNPEENVIAYNVNNDLTKEQKIEFLKQEISRLTGQEYKEENNRIKRKGGYGTGRR